MRRTSFTTVAILLSVSLTGCTMKARLYNLTSGEVVQATFKYGGTGRGSLKATMPSGEEVSGEYRTVPEGYTAWGSIWGRVSTQYGTAVGNAQSVSAISPNMQRGTAVAVGTEGTVLDCEYVTKSTGASGYGYCTDNKGNSYRLMF